MKNLLNACFVFCFSILIFIGCNNSDDNDKNIVYQTINKEYVLIKNVQTLLASDDEISNHVDSILNGLIDSEFISTGQKSFDLNSDAQIDVGFEIIDLHNFNPNGLPESFDSLAARVIPIRVEILDNSTYGYPDALNFDDQISENGNWTNSTSVLGTFMNAGQFQGNGEKYLGIRLSNENNYKYGWIKVYCSQHNDTLRIIDYAYNNIIGSEIKAGQVD
jgi:hypothetical protein